MGHAVTFYAGNLDGGEVTQHGVFVRQRRLFMLGFGRWNLKSSFRTRLVYLFYFFCLFMAESYFDSQRSVHLRYYSFHELWVLACWLCECRPWLGTWVKKADCLCLKVLCVVRTGKVLRAILISRYHELHWQRWHATAPIVLRPVRLSLPLVKTVPIEFLSY